MKWAITSAIYPVEKDTQRLTKYVENSKKFNWDGINFPASLRDIDKFEKQNPSISVNVFGYEKDVYPLRITKNANPDTVNLLLISEGENQHFTWVKNVSRLLTSQFGTHAHKRHYCLRCLNSFHAAESLQRHEFHCSRHEAIRVELPDKQDNKLLLTHYNPSMKTPIVIYADFESFTRNIAHAQPRDNNQSYTIQYQRHIPSGFSYYMKCSFDLSYDKKVKYTKRSEDEDISQIFVKILEEDIRRIYHKFKFPKKMVLTEEDKANFEKASKCHICEKLLGKDQVRDHCHLTGCHGQYKYIHF